MPAFPVTRGGILLNGAAAPACLITNAGPGSLYLYRNSAVSSTVYDTVIGPQGSGQWPGGELWAASDSTCTVNVLTGLTAFDSGTTQVAGTVTVAGSGSAVSPVSVRNSRSGSWTGDFQSVPIASDYAVGDTVYRFVFGSGSWTPVERATSGRTWWTQVAQYNNGGTYNITVYRRVLTGETGERNTQFGVGNNTTATYSDIAFVGDRTFTPANSNTSLASGDTTISTGSTVAPTFILAIGYRVTLSWPNALQGGPPSGGKSWTAANGLSISAADWTPAAAYNALFTVPASQTGAALIGTVA